MRRARGAKGKVIIFYAAKNLLARARQVPMPFAKNALLRHALNGISSYTTCAMRASGLRAQGNICKAGGRRVLEPRPHSAACAKDHAPRDQIAQRRDAAQRRHADAARRLQR